MAALAVELLNLGKPGYNPEKGKSYLEYSFKGGKVGGLDVPAPVLLELIRSERLAVEKARSLEQQLEIMKAIDMAAKED